MPPPPPPPNHASTFQRLITGTADQNFYPESLYKLFVVNTPALISVAWRLISPWIDARTRAKIVFLKPHETAAELLQHIHEEDLPVDLGGKCECEGGCMLETMPSEDDGFTCVPIKVKKGAKATLPVSVESGHVISWDFVVEAHDVCFRAVAAGANITEGAL